MRLVLTVLLAGLGLMVALGAAVAGWRLFEGVHEWVTIVVYDEREVRAEGPLWRDFLRYWIFYLPVAACALIAYLGAGMAVWKLARLVRSGDGGTRIR